ncbi:MAG: hypothetical protein PHP93_03810 [Kiritimatiellales bacterium]|nr:hypothetical protein [Kiritimatiellales bacterium]
MILHIDINVLFAVVEVLDYPEGAVGALPGNLRAHCSQKKKHPDSSECQPKSGI